MLDSEVLSALAEGDHRALAIIKAIHELGLLVWVPAVVLAETVTGDPGRDAAVNRVVKRLRVAEVDEQVGRLAGRLRYESGLTAATVDALVVATAAVHGAGRVASVDPNVVTLADHAKVPVVRLPGR